MLTTTQQKALSKAKINEMRAWVRKLERACRTHNFNLMRTCLEEEQENRAVWNWNDSAFPLDYVTDKDDLQERAETSSNS